MSTESPGPEAPIFAVHVAISPVLAQQGGTVPVTVDNDPCKFAITLIDAAGTSHGVGTKPAHQATFAGTVDGLSALVASGVADACKAVIDDPDLAARNAAAVDILGVTSRVRSEGVTRVAYAFDGPTDAHDAPPPDILPMPAPPPDTPAGLEGALATIAQIVGGLVGSAADAAAQRASSRLQADLAEMTQARDVCHGLLEAAQSAMEDARGELAAAIGDNERLRARVAELEAAGRAAQAAREAAEDDLANARSEVLDLKLRHLVGGQSVDCRMRRLAAQLPSGYRLRIVAPTRLAPADRDDGYSDYSAVAAATYRIERWLGVWTHVATYGPLLNEWTITRDNLGRLKAAGVDLAWRDATPRR